MNILNYLYLKLINKVKIHLFLYEYYYNFYYTCMNKNLSLELNRAYGHHPSLCLLIYLLKLKHNHILHQVLLYLI